MHTGRFSWQQHGPADFSQCYALIGRLPAAHRRRLNGTVKEVFAHILSVFMAHARQGKTTVYGYFSRTYLAQALGRSVRTIGRALQTLRVAGLLDRIRRHPVGARFRTSLTKPGKALLALLYRTTHAKPQRNQRGPLLSHNDLKKENRTPQAGRGGPISTIGNVIRGLVSGKTTLTGRPKPSPPDPVLGKEELAVTDFASLKAYLQKSHR